MLLINWSHEQQQSQLVKVLNAWCVFGFGVCEHCQARFEALNIIILTQH